MISAPDPIPSRPLRLACLAAASALLVACGGQAPAPAPAAPRTVVASGSEDAGAVSSDARPPEAIAADRLKGRDWPELRLVSGDAWVDCDADLPIPRADAGVGASGDEASVAVDGPADHTADPAADLTADPAAAALGVGAAAATPGQDDADAQAANGEPDRPVAETDAQAGVAAAEDNEADVAAPRPLVELGFEEVEAAMAPCRERGTVRLRYQGKISGDFTALVQRAAAMADRMDIGVRILDVDSTGGRVEDAMPAGDAIAGSHWTIRVRPDSICHSACVLVLAAGDDREIGGKVGIHRMVRVGSQATTRAELSQELREVYGEIKEYLERNGASVAVADLMMTVPNRSLRLLGENELREYGLSGANAVQDDLDRIILARKCGEDFVKRRDAYLRAYASRCALAEGEEAVEACALSLRGDYGFPDEKCAADGPLAGTPLGLRIGAGSAPAAATTAAATAGKAAAAGAR